MTYEIRDNGEFNSKEIYFDGKPSEAVRTALKALKFRWHGKKRCWYGYADENTLISAILGTNEAPDLEEPAAVITDGYLGGGAVYGSKSRMGLYGKDLKKAIAEDIKKAGIKGVTLSMRYGSNPVAKIKTTADDLISLDEFKKVFEINSIGCWVDYLDEEGNHKSIHLEQLQVLDYEEKQKIFNSAAELAYRREALKECTLNEFHLDKYKVFTSECMERIKKISNIISSYRYDESNSMVDYFNTNFYYYLVTVPKAA